MVCSFYGAIHSNVILVGQCKSVKTENGGGGVAASQLVTQSTRHKEAVNSSQANKQANIKAVLP